MIGLLCFNSLRYAQFIFKYTSILDKNNIPYEVVYWNREGDSIPPSNNWIPFEKRIDTFQPFYKKIKDFISFSRFMKKTIKDRGYDKLIVLTTQTAVPLSKLLRASFKDKYIFDYRDVTYENFKFYQRIVNKIVYASRFTAISSEGFIRFGYVPPLDGKVVLSHNSRNIEEEFVSKKKTDIIKVCYWGQVRQLEFNKRVCDLFGSDDRFLLTYHGAGYHRELQEFVQAKGYKNISFTGAYKLDDISSFAKDTDLILNAYENDKQQKPAMTVKYYDSLRFGIPMIVTSGSFMAENVESNHLGISVDFGSNVDMERIVDYHFSETERCDRLAAFGKVLKQVQEDDAVFEERLVAFANE